MTTVPVRDFGTSITAFRAGPGGSVLWSAPTGAPPATDATTTLGFGTGTGSRQVIPGTSNAVAGSAGASATNKGWRDESYSHANQSTTICTLSGTWTFFYSLGGGVASSTAQMTVVVYAVTAANVTRELFRNTSGNFSITTPSANQTQTFTPPNVDLAAGEILQYEFWLNVSANGNPVSGTTIAFTAGAAGAGVSAASIGTASTTNTIIARFAFQPINLVVGRPIFGTPATSLLLPPATPLITGSPLFGTPTVYFKIAAPPATPLVTGSPLFGTPTATQDPTHLTTGHPIFGTPQLHQNHHLTALALVPGSPNFGSGRLHQSVTAIVDGVFLPENIEHAATGGPRFNTSIFIGANGFEYRSTNWQRQLGRWSINLGYREDTDPDFLAVLNTFYVVRGNGFGFLFRDWSDFSAKNQPLGLVSGSPGIYQLQKVYAAGVGSYARKITRPEAGTVVVKLSGVPQAATVNYNGGIVSGVPAGCTASFNFKIPVRFDTDILDIAVERGALKSEPGVVNITQIDLVELGE